MKKNRHITVTILEAESKSRKNSESIPQIKAMKKNSTDMKL